MGLSGEEAAMLDVPQDRFLKFENGSADWI
jgi:hypothetical protein